MHGVSPQVSPEQIPAHRHGKNLGPPVVVLLLAAVAVLWVADLHVVYSWPHVQTGLSLLTRVLGALLLAMFLARGFLQCGEPALLWISGGTLIWGGAGVLVDAAATLPANVSVTVGDLGALCAALCHALGLASAIRAPPPLGARGRWLAAGTLLALLALALIALPSFYGWLPAFFVPGRGGSDLHFLAIGPAALVFSITAGLLWQAHRAVPSPFLRRDGFALMLLAVGLIGTAGLSSPGSPLDWAARAAWYLAGLYIMAAGLATARSPPSLAPLGPAWAQAAWLGGEEDRSPSQWLGRYGLACAAVAAGLGLRLGAESVLGLTLPTFITFYPAITAVALIGGLLPGLSTALLSHLAVAYWVAAPFGRFQVDSPSDRVALLLFDGMGVFICVIAHLFRQNRRKAAAYEQELALRDVRREMLTLAHILERCAQPFAMGYPDGRLVRCNAAFETLTGYSAAELVDLRWPEDLTPPEWHALER